MCFNLPFGPLELTGNFLATVGSKLIFYTPHGTVQWPNGHIARTTTRRTISKLFFCHWLAAIALPFRNVPKVNLIAHDTSKHKKLNLVFLQQFGQKKKLKHSFKGKVMFFVFSEFFKDKKITLSRRTINYAYHIICWK